MYTPAPPPYQTHYHFVITRVQATHSFSANIHCFGYSGDKDANPLPPGSLLRAPRQYRQPLPTDPYAPACLRHWLPPLHSPLPLSTVSPINKRFLIQPRSRSSSTTRQSPMNDWDSALNYLSNSPLLCSFNYQLLRIFTQGRRLGFDYFLSSLLAEIMLKQEHQYAYKALEKQVDG